jgi:uridine kinase
MSALTPRVEIEPQEDMLCELAEGQAKNIDALLNLTRADAFITEVFRGRLSDSLFYERTTLWPSFITALRHSRYSDLLTETTIWELWRYPITIAQLFAQSNYKIVTLAGPPGSGKTTLAALCLCYLTLLDPATSVIAVSLDDFYFSKAERAARGIKWRAQPGSHDIAQAVHLLKSVSDGITNVTIPRFNHASDDQGEPEVTSRRVDKLIVEGWFVGLPDLGYQRLNDFVDLRIYVDCSVELAKSRRFRREEKIRAASNHLRCQRWRCSGTPYSSLESPSGFCQSGHLQAW